MGRALFESLRVLALLASLLGALLGLFVIAAVLPQVIVDDMPASLALGAAVLAWVVLCIGTFSLLVLEEPGDRGDALPRALVIGVHGLIVAGAAVALVLQGGLALLVLIAPISLLSIATLLRRIPAIPTDVCPGCGYPLKGLPGPRCPECGMRIATVARDHV